MSMSTTTSWRRNGLATRANTSPAGLSRTLLDEGPLKRRQSAADRFLYVR
jgi:hypothetical protein